MENKGILVSIIVPIYGTEAYLPACIDSSTDSSEKFNDEISSAKPPTVKINPQNVPSNPKNIKIFVLHKTIARAIRQTKVQ